MIKTSRANGLFSHLSAITDQTVIVVIGDKHGIAVEADDLSVQVHPNPAHAFSDGRQSPKPDKFAKQVKQVKTVALAVGRRLAPVQKPVQV